MKRRLLALVALASSALLLSGCLYAAIPPEAPVASPAPSRAPDVRSAPTGFERYYGQELEWEPCTGAGTGRFDCTTVTAPLDWTAPDGGEIELAVIRRAADGGDALGSLLTNPGGPGASGYGIVADSADIVLGSALREAYDVIGFDPRGVGRSTAVTCFDDADMDDYLFGIPESPRGSDEWEAELTAANERFIAACEEGSHGILPFITTDNAARDMDLLRAALGDEQLHYLGFSYGTFLGATYAKLFPDRVGRLVLDGAMDPSIPGIDVGIVQAAGFESALRAYLAVCLEGRDCPFRGTVDEAMADLGVLLASVDRTPLESSDGRLLGSSSLVTGIVSALYSRESWSYLTTALREVLEGSPETMFFLADYYYDRVDGVYRDNSTEAFNAYNCMDYPAETDEAALAAADARIAAEAPTIAPYWSSVDLCASWPYPATGVRERIAAEGAAPIVVVGTTNDPATPYAWAVALAEQLSSGVLITREGEGHTGYGRGSSCVDAAVEAYLVDGTVPDDGLVCR